MVYSALIAAALAAGAYASPQAGQACFTKDCCDTQANACRTAPNANQAFCSAQQAACYGAIGLPNPFTPTNSTGTVGNPTIAPTLTGLPSGTGLPMSTTYVSLCPVPTTPIVNGTPCPTYYYTPSTVTEACPCTAVPTYYSTYCPITQTYSSGTGVYTTTYPATVTVTEVPVPCSTCPGTVSFSKSTILPMPPSGVPVPAPSSPVANAPAPSSPVGNAPAPSATLSVPAYIPPSVPQYTGAAAVATPAAGLLAAALFALL